LTTDVVLFAIKDSELCVLTITRATEPYLGKYTLPGGFLHAGETSRNSATRVLQQKTSLDNIYIEQLFTFDGSDRDPRGDFVSVAYMAFCDYKSIVFDISPKSQNPEFLPTETKLGFDHNEIVDYAVSRLKNKIEYTNIIKNLLPAEFTFLQLQQYYEVILGEKLDKRNFRKKFMSLDLIEKTGNMLTGGKQRPAEMYKFRSQDFVQLRRWF
jgi:8-oxo-dGTP diphosphatase